MRSGDVIEIRKGIAVDIDALSSSVRNVRQSSLYIH